jgi:hypothetical protein
MLILDYPFWKIQRQLVFRRLFHPGIPVPLQTGQVSSLVHTTNGYP